MAAGIYLCAVEFELLAGLPALAQRLYVLGIRPQMCFKTGVVGRSSRVSWHGLARELRVEAAPGIREELPSKAQVRRACEHLVRVGLVTMQSVDKRLMLRCVEARLSSDEQIKADTKPAREAGTKQAVVSKPQARAASAVGDDLDSSMQRLADSMAQGKPPHIGVSEEDQKNSLSAGAKKFAIPWDWHPFDADRFAEACAMSGVCWDALGSEVRELIRVEFVRYWMARSGDKATQAQWEHRFIQSVQYQVSRGVNRFVRQQGVQV